MVRSVTTPLEININGADGMQYMQSYSSSNGIVDDHVHVRARYQPDNRPDQRSARRRPNASAAPESRAEQGVSVEKSSGNITIAVAMLSTSSSVCDIGSATTPTSTSSKSSSGFRASVRCEVLGDRTYGMRIWVDPHKLQANNVSLAPSLNAIKQQERQRRARCHRSAADDRLAAFQIPIKVNGRLTSPEEFGRSSSPCSPTADTSGSATSPSRTRRAKLHHVGAVQRPDGRGAGDRRRADSQLAADLQKRARDDGAAEAVFPTGMDYEIAFDTSDFVQASIKEVVVTLFIAILLVVLVIFIFLQNWHSTLIPSITIPVSLIGTFAAMKLLGFTINTLTLFGLTLATGLVVDDAIVVLENIVRHIVNDKSQTVRGD